MLDVLKKVLDENSRRELHTSLRNTRQLPGPVRDSAPPGDLLGVMVELMRSSGIHQQRPFLDALRRVWPALDAWGLDAQLEWQQVRWADMASEVEAMRRGAHLLIGLEMETRRAEVESALTELDMLLNDRHLSPLGILVSLRDHTASRLTPHQRERLDRLVGFGSNRDAKAFLVRLVKALRIEVSDGVRPTDPKVMLESVRIPDSAGSAASDKKIPRGEVPPEPAATYQHALAFFQEMNLSTYDHLLDRLLEASLLRDRYRKGEVTAADFADFLSPVMVNLFKFFRNQSLRPIHITGSTFTMSEPEQVLTYDYRGSVFSDGEVKTMLVESPGWMLGDTRVSRPAIRERRPTVSHQEEQE
jgi:hypothetical protein